VVHNIHIARPSEWVPCYIYRLLLRLRDKWRAYGIEWDVVRL